MRGLFATTTEIARAQHGRITRRQLLVLRLLPGNPPRPEVTVAKLRHAPGADVVLSPLEARFVRLMREHGLPVPRTNIDVHADKVDCHWPVHGLAIELHSSAPTLEGRDRTASPRRT